MYDVVKLYHVFSCVILTQTIACRTLTKFWFSYKFNFCRPVLAITTQSRDTSQQFSCYCASNAFTDFVGFSAYTTSHQYGMASGTVISLPGVVTNAGGAYNPDTSTFTCPTTAYYYIYFSLNLAVTGLYYDCHIDITMDDSMIVEVRHRDKCCDDKKPLWSCALSSF